MPSKTHDDCDWNVVYPEAHYKDMVEIEKNNQFDLPEQHSVIDGKLKYEGKPLLKNAEWLYEKIYELNPKSVFEVGFGYGNHLLSIHRMLPDIEIAGCDISYNQICNGLNKYSDFVDIYDDYLFAWGDFLHLYIKQKYDVVYSQAVLMHMATEKSMVSLEKMCSISNKYVICLEGGLTIPNTKEWLQKLGNVTFFDDWAKENWDSEYNVSPFIIEV